MELDTKQKTEEKQKYIGFTKLLAGALTAVTLFLFIAPGNLWAHWDDSVVARSAVETVRVLGNMVAGFDDGLGWVKKKTVALVASVTGRNDEIATPQDAGLPPSNSAGTRNDSGPSLLARLIAPLRQGVSFISSASWESIASRFRGQTVEVADNGSEVDLSTGRVAGVSTIASEVDSGKILQGANLSLAEIAGQDGKKLAVATPINIQPAAKAAAPVTKPAATPKLQIKKQGPITVTQAVYSDNSVRNFILKNALTTTKTIQALAGLVSGESVLTEGLAVGPLGAGISGHLTVTGDTILRSSLVVTGNTLLSGNVAVAGTLSANNFNPQTITTSSLTTSGLSANFISTKSLSASGPITGNSINGVYGSFSSLSAKELSVGGNSSDTISLKGSTTISAPLTVSGAASLASTLAVTGASTLSSTLTVAGAASLSSTLAVTGATTLTGLLTASGGISIAAPQTLTGTSTRALAVKDDLADTFVVDTVADAATLTGGSTSTPALLITQAGQDAVLSLQRTNTSATKPGAEVTVATSTALALTSQSGSASTTLAVYQQGSGAAATFQGGKIGIGTASPSYLLHLQSTASPQLAVGYDTGNYFTTAVASDGAVTLNTNGVSGAAFAFQDNLTVATTTANQFKTGYDASNYLAFTTDAGGTTTLSVIGGQFAALKVASALRVATSSAFALEIEDGTGTKLLTANTLTNRIGVGTTTPGALFAVGGNALVQNTLTVGNFIATDSTATSTLATGLAVGTSQFVVDRATGKVGVGTAAPATALHVQNTTSPQLALAYDATNYYTTAVSATGGITFTRYGSALANGFTFADTLNVATSTTETILTVNSTNSSNGTTTLAVYQAGTGRGLFLQRTNTSAATPLAELYTATSSALTLISGSGSATSTLSVYQQGTNGPIVLFTDTNASTTPAFKIAAITRDVEVREDYVQRSHADLTALTNINDVFVYDTTKDADGGKWRMDNRAQSTSWYNETLDATAQGCSISSNDRCGRKEFPEKAVIIGTNSNVYIFDAKDNSMWMRFDGASNNMLYDDSTYVFTSVYGLGGVIYVGLKTPASTDGSIYHIDFKSDKRISANNLISYKYNGTISQRNSASGQSSASSDLYYPLPIYSAINDISVAVINGKTYVAVGTDAGLSIINETDRTVVDMTDTTFDDIERIRLTSDGRLYFIQTDDTSYYFTFGKMPLYDIPLASSWRDGIYYGNSTPSLDATGASAVNRINDFTVTEGTSFVDGKSNTIFIAHNKGLTKISQKQNDESNGAVKYYQTATTTEEMIGDIRGMWPLNNLGDASVKGYSLSNENSTTLTASGVRGTAATFNGSNQRLTGTISLPTSGFAYGAWVKPTTSPSSGTDKVAMSFGLSNTGRGTLLGLGGVTANVNGIPGQTIDGSKIGCYTVDSSGANTYAQTQTTITAGIWYYVICSLDQSGSKVYVNGALGASNPSVTVNVGTSDFVSLGSYVDSTRYWDGVLDEPFITAEALTPSQIKYMYEVGKKALESHTSGRITGISGADSYQQLYGTANIVKAISVDVENNLLYAATSDGSTAAGGVSAIGLGSDSLTDVWGLGGGTGPGKTSDTGVAWDSTASYSQVNTLSLSPRYPKTLAIGTAGMLWLETEQFSLDKYRSESYNPHGETLTQTNLTVNYKLDVGNELAVYGKVLGATDSPSAPGGSAKPTFRVSSDGTVTVRDDILFTGRTTLTGLSGINDVFVYDTTKDSDGGEWTCNDIARATSWYNEPLNTSTRGKTRCFPRKAVIVGLNVSTGAGLYIYDTKDNSMWMRFDANSSPNDFFRNFTSPSAFALNGKIYVGIKDGSGIAGLRAIDFVNDLADWYDTHAVILHSRFNGAISKRNSAPGYTTFGTASIVSTYVNDVSAAVVNGKTYVAVGTDNGASIINETDGTVFDIDRSGTTDQSRFVRLTSDGYVYLHEEQAATGINTINVFAIPTADITINGASRIAQHGNTSATGIVFPVSATTVKHNAFEIIERNSFIDGMSNSIYVGTAEGLAVVSEKRGDETNGSIRWYTKDYISEEMVGDVRGMWPLEGKSNGLADASVKAQTLTNNNAVTFNKAGVRGHAADFVAASSMSLSDADHADYTFTTAMSAGVWFFRDIDSGGAEGLFTKYDVGAAADRTFVLYLESNDTVIFITVTAGPTQVSSVGPAISTGTWNHVVGTYDGAIQRIYLNGVLVDSDALTGSMIDSAEILAMGALTNTDAPYSFFDGRIDEPFLTAETLTPSQIKRMYETGKRALEGGTEGVASSATSAHSAFRIGVAAGAVKYSAGQFIGSVIQVYGSGSATSTRFVTQTASSTSDYYIQFSPDHTATIANNNTFSIGPNALQGSSNRVTALAVDDMRDFIYIGTTDATGVNGMVTKIALDSDTVTDVWHPSAGKADDASQPFGTASTTAISIAGNTLAIGGNDTSNGGLWSEYQQETLDHKINGPKSVFTVIDRIQTPKITTVSGVLTIGTATSTSLTIGTATTTGQTIQIKAGPSQNLLLSGDSNNGLYVTAGGNVGIGTTGPAVKLVVNGNVTLGNGSSYANMVTNGSAWTGASGATPPTGWTGGGSVSPTWDIISGGLRLTGGSSGPASNTIYQTISGLVVGETYNASYQLKRGTSGYTTVYIGSSGPGGTEYGNNSDFGTVSFTQYNSRFVATGTTAYIYIELGAPTGVSQTAFVDEVTLTRESWTHIDGLMFVTAGTAVLPSIAGATDTNTGVSWLGSDTLALTTGGVSRVYITPTGLGIGKSAPSTAFQTVTNEATYAWQLQNIGNSTDNAGIIVSVGTNDASGVNNAFRIDDGDGTNQGVISFTSGTVTYGQFTANHDVAIPEKYNAKGYPYGTLLCIDRTYSANRGERAIDYDAQACTTAYATNIIGSYAGKYNDKPNRHQVYILGDGHILVNGEGGDIKVGDPLVTSSTPGIGMKPTHNGLAIGVAQENHSFKNKDEVYKMPVQYGLRYWYDESFVPITDGKISDVVKRIERQEKGLEDLRRAFCMTNPSASVCR